jgi:hypothetical protein
MEHSPGYEELVAGIRHEVRRDSIRETLAARFGKAAASEFAQRLNNVSDQEQLSKLFRAAIKCRRIRAFRRVLRACQP